MSGFFVSTSFPSSHLRAISYYKVQIAFQLKSRKQYLDTSD